MERKEIEKIYLNKINQLKKYKSKKIKKKKEMGLIRKKIKSLFE